LRTTSTDWEQVVIRWDDVQKVAWFGDMGVEAFDPAQVVWLMFDIGTWDTAQVGTLWIDSITLNYEQ
jgi:hypothetical protein